MASQEEFAPTNADFNIVRGPSFRDVLDALYFSPQAHLMFRFEDDEMRTVYFGRLVGQISRHSLGHSFTLLIFEYTASGAKTRTFVIYDMGKRIGIVFNPKSLQDLLDFEAHLKKVDHRSTKWGKNA